MLARAQCATRLGGVVCCCKHPIFSKPPFSLLMPGAMLRVKADLRSKDEGTKERLNKQEMVKDTKFNDDVIEDDS